MAIQKSLINAEGKIGDLSFYNAKDKAIIRRNPGVRREHIVKDLTIPAQTFRLELPEASSDLLMICLGISFYKKPGSFPVSIMGQGRNILEVVGVKLAADGR